MERTLIPLRILGIPLLLMGLALGAYGFYTLVVDLTGSVEQREAVVEGRRSEQRRAAGPRGGQHEVTVLLLRFRYQVNGESHSVEREVPKNTELGRAEVGTRVRIYTRQQDPKDVLLQEPNATHGLALLMGAAFLTVIGAIGTRALFIRGRTPTAQRDPGTWRSRPHP